MGRAEGLRIGVMVEGLGISGPLGCIELCSCLSDDSCGFCGFTGSQFGVYGFGFLVKITSGRPRSWHRPAFQGFDFGIRVLGVGSRVSGFEFRVSGFGLEGFWSRVSSFPIAGFRVSGRGFKGFGLRIRASSIGSSPSLPGSRFSGSRVEGVPVSRFRVKKVALQWRWGRT